MSIKNILDKGINHKNTYWYFYVLIPLSSAFGKCTCSRIFFITPCWKNSSALSTRFLLLRLKPFNLKYTVKCNVHFTGISLWKGFKRNKSWFKLILFKVFPIFLNSILRKKSKIKIKIRILRSWFWFLFIDFFLPIEFWKYGHLKKNRPYFCMADSSSAFKKNCI